MLRGVPDIIGSDLLKALADTGHGDLIVIADHFYPPVTKSPNAISIQGLVAGRMAHQSGGVLFLRVEDTDAKREVPGAVEVLINTLKHYGIHFDEGATIDGDSGAYGPYRQRQRAAIYHVYAKQLVLQGDAYPCFCTEEELTAMRAEQEAKKVNFGYYGAQETYSADAVVLAIGVFPETKLAAAAGLEIGKTGAIHVNENYQTNDPDIYAVGDAIEVYDPQTHVWRKLALAGPAQFEARAAADHICGITSPNHGFAGALCLRVFGQNAAAVGISEALAARSGLHADSVLMFPGDKVGIMPDWHYMSLKLIFERPTGLILGAQAIGEGDVVGRMNVIAAMIRMHATVYDLKDMTLCYSPVYSTAKDPVNQAVLVAINVLEGQLRQVHVSAVRSLVESGAYIVDVREEGEYAEGHLVGSHNIPLTQLRARMEEIPKDVPVYLHCRSSQRSYYALCCLRGHGYHNLTNISGSFLGISLYEYFHDKSEGRKPIVTAYNFD